MKRIGDFDFDFDFEYVIGAGGTASAIEPVDA